MVHVFFSYIGNFPLLVDLTQFAPGDHDLLITATSTGGEVATQEVLFSVPEPLGM